MPYDRHDTPTTMQAPPVNQDALVAMWERQWEKVPPSLYCHIQQSQDINPNASLRFESIGITGAYEATRTMIVTDYAYGICRMGYEAWQGQDDFGWNTRQPNWRKPEILTFDPDNSRAKYTGSESMVHKETVEWRNSGVLKIDSVLNLDSDAALFQSEEESRKGGFGQGLKILLASSVANKQDRINAIRLSLDKGLAGKLTDFQASRMRQAIDNLTFALEAEGEVDTFSTVQAKSTDGKYYRTYCYREPFRSNNLDLWKLRYIVCELDEQKIPEDQKGQVIVAIHQPDTCLGQVLDTMPRNLLCLDPEYNHPRNIVRQENDPRPLVEVQTIPFSADVNWSFTDHIDGNFDVQRLKRTHEDGSGGVFFRGSRLLPEVNPSMNTVFDYNLDKLDAAAAKVIARSSNSTYVTGPIDTIISCATGQITDPKEWEVIFRKASELQAAGVEITPQSWPELCPKAMNSYDLHKKKSATESMSSSAEVREAVTKAFNSIWPESEGYFCRSQEEADHFCLVTGRADLKIPIIANNQMEQFLWFEGDLKPVGAELSQEFSRRFNYNEKGYSKIALATKETLDEIRRSPEYQKIMSQGPLAINDFLRLALIDYDIFDLKEDGKTYTIDAPFGHHVLDIVYNDPFTISRLFSFLTSDYYSFRAQERSIALAAIDSGIRFSIETNSYYSNQSENFYVAKTGEMMFVVGTPQRAENGQRFGTLRIHGTQDELLKSLSYLDKTIGLTYPNLIINRPGNEFQKAAQTINDTLKLLNPNDTVKGEPLESVKRMLEEAQQQKQEAEDALKKFKGEVKRRIGGNNGSINGSQMTGRLPGGGSISPMYEAGKAFGRSSGANTYESIPRQHYSLDSKERQINPERIVFKDADYTISLYDGKLPNDMHPLEAYETVEYRSGKIVQTSEFNDLVIAEEGEGPWRSYNPNEGPSYIARRSSSGVNYDGIVEVRKDILPITNETVLPIDCLNSQIVYIQLPVKEGESPEPPMLMEDLVNNQYHLVFAENGQPEALKTLPRGTRIYIKERDRKNADDERHLIRHYPDYYQRLTRSIINESKLDREAQVVLKAIRDRIPPLNHDEKMQAVNEFWYKRRLYDKEGIESDTIEQLIESGIGVCAQSELAMTQMVRFVGVPCRTRVCYPDNRRTGQMSPPLHAEIEYIDDEGKWQRWDPPNSRTTDSYAQSLAREAISGNVPEIYDANSLGRFEDRDIKLPHDIRYVVDKVVLRKGSSVSPSTADTMSRVLKGEKVDPGKIIEDLIEAVQSIGEGKAPKEKKSRVTAKDIQSVLDFLSVSNLKLIALQTMYGLDSEQVARYQEKTARNLARKLIETLGK